MTALPDYPNEVVTKALVRLVRVPGLDKPAALITLDNGLDYKKPNSFGPGGLRSLDEAITKATEANPAFLNRCWISNGCQNFCRSPWKRNRPKANS